MISKDKEYIKAKNPKIAAGDDQERNVAFQLKRAFKDSKTIYVFNDLKINFNDENAQIDHLILYEYGFVLIESKSVKGEVKINKHKEWSRSFNGQWKGMQSPIKQAELQEYLLKMLLDRNKLNILDKYLGVVQGGFGGRCYNSICAVSSDAIIHRDSMPKEMSDKLIKTEFLPEKILKIMNFKSHALRAVTLDTRPKFTGKELESINNFLLSHHESIDINNQKCVQSTSSDEVINIDCKHCNNKELGTLKPMHGRFGYYVKCQKCLKNTSMNSDCISCGNKEAKVQKRKESYNIVCEACNSKIPVKF